MGYIIKVFISFGLIYSMQTKYVIVLGSLLSGLGKGIVTASISKIFKFYGYKAMPLKFDGYLNYDCGTMNPYRHGEVFVLNDKSEVDMDFGTYERFLDLDMNGNLSITGGKLFSEIISMERKGGFLGRDVQIVPHLTNLIIKKIKEVASDLKLDFLVIEVGGTVGDIENSYFIEAMRQLSLTEKTMFVNVTYIPKLDVVGEQKTKPTQIANRNLMQLGIIPDILVCRADCKLAKNVKEKLALFSNLPVENIIEDVDIRRIYDLPKIFMNQNLDKILIDKFGLNKAVLDKALVNKWKTESSVKKTNLVTKISVVGKYVNLHDSYASIIAALEDAAIFNNTKLDINWIESEKLEDSSLVGSLLDDSKGILVPGGFGKRGIGGMINAVTYARKNKLAYLGICLGMQLMAIEYARNVCNLKDANSLEFDNEAEYKVVNLMEDQKDIKLKGGTMRLGSWPVQIDKNTLAYSAYGKEMAHERHRHRYEFNNEFIDIFEKNNMVFSGRSPDRKIIEMIEWDNGLGIGTQSHPEFKSKPGNPAPLFKKFIRLSMDVK